MTLPIYDGVVRFDDGQVPVILGLEDHTIRLSSGGSEIGEWGDGEYKITDLGDGTYHITAENETLHFVPNQPNLLAAELGNGEIEVVERRPPPTPPASEAPLEIPSSPSNTTRVEAPPPRPITRAAFYTLAGTTAALGLWSLIRLIFS